MELITKKTILANLVERYKNQYPKNVQFFDGTFSADLLKKLEDEKELTEQKANAILNDSWTRNKCHECQQDVDAVVQIGDEPDYESHTANICLPCLLKAVDLIKTKK
jgi:hypothetical protein